MAFDSAKIGNINHAANTFTDGDAVERTCEVAQLGFGAVNSIPTIVSAADPLPVTLPSLSAIEGYVDGIEASLGTIVGHVDGLEGLLATLGGYVDGLEGLLTGVASGTKQDTGNTSLASIDGKLPALGQALAAASVPVILPSATITTLTPPAAITGFATAANQATGLGYVDGIETLLASLDGKTTAVNTGAVVVASGTLTTVTTITTLTTCSTVTTVGTLTGGGIAHDGVDSGNPVKIGVKATASVLGATPVAAADRTDLFAGTDGVLINRPYSSLEDIISEVKTNTDGASTAMVGAFAATVSQRIYLTTLCLANSSATAITVDIRDGTGGSVLFTVPVPAGAGVVVSFPVPLRFTANTAMAFDGSAAVTTLTVSAVGFKSKT